MLLTPNSILEGLTLDLSFPDLLPGDLDLALGELGGGVLLPLSLDPDREADLDFALGLGLLLPEAGGGGDPDADLDLPRLDMS